MQKYRKWASHEYLLAKFERFIIAGPRGYSKARYTKWLQIQKTCQRNSQRSQKVLALFCIDARPLEKGMKACRTQK